MVILNAQTGLENRRCGQKLGDRFLLKMPCRYIVEQEEDLTLSPDRSRPDDALCKVRKCNGRIDHQPVPRPRRGRETS